MDLGELADLLDEGVAMLGASADPQLAPEAFRAWGATLEGRRLRVLVSSDAGRTLAAIADGARVALAFTDICTFRSLQVKGRVAGGPAPAGPGDAAVLRRYAERFGAKLAEIGHPPSLGAKLRPTSVFVVSLDIDALYDQTPGPGAGAELEVA